MFIKEFTIKNFRSFKNQKTISVNSNYTVFTGENNCGKSNVFRALDEFFNGIIDGESYNAYDDMHLQTIDEASREQTTISVSFSLDVKKDRNIIAALDKLKTNNSIVDFDIDNLVISLGRTKQNIQIVQYIEPVNRYRKQSDEISAFFTETVRRSINFVYVPAVKDLNQFINRGITNELLKRIFNTWGRGRNPRAQDFKNRFELIKSGITDIINDANQNITKILKEQSDQIANFIFTLPFKDVTEFLSDLPISIEDNLITDIKRKGSGIQAITLITLIRYLDKFKPTNKYLNAQYIWAVEEPETFLHPKAQVKLYEAFNKYSLDTQIFITTHNYNFLNTNSLQSNYLLAKELISNTKYDQTTIIENDGNNNWEPFLKILGDFQPSFIPPSDYTKRYLFMEGQFDIRYVKKALDFEPELKTYFENEIIFMDGGGDEIKRRASDSKKLFKLHTIVLVDGDEQGKSYFNHLSKEGFVENDDIFILNHRTMNNPTIEGIVSKNREDEFKLTMPDDARNYYYAPRILSLFDNVPMRPPQGWDKNSIKSKMVEYMETNGTIEDFKDLLPYLRKIKSKTIRNK